MSRCPVSRHRPMATVVEDALHLGGVLHHRADVRVQGRGDAHLHRQVSQPAEVAQQRRPARLVQDRACVVPLLSGRRGEHQGAGPRLDEGLQRGPDCGYGVVPRVVQDRGDEPANGMKTVVRQYFCPRARFLRKEARRPELRGREAHLAHLVEHGGGVVLPPPAGHLAHPPRDRRRGDALAQGAPHGATSTVSSELACMPMTSPGRTASDLRDRPSVVGPAPWCQPYCRDILTLRHSRCLISISACL